MVEQIVTKYLGGLVTVTGSVEICGNEKVTRIDTKIVGICVKSQSATNPLTTIDKMSYAAAITAKNAVKK